MIITNKGLHPSYQRNVSLPTTVEDKIIVHLKSKDKRTIEEHNKILTDITKVATVGTIPILREIKEILKATKSPVKKEEVNPEKKEMTKTVKVTDKANRTETKKVREAKNRKKVKKTKTVKAKTAEVLQTKNLTDTNRLDLTVNLYRRVDKEVKEVKAVKEEKVVKDLLIGTTFPMKKKRISVMR